MDSKGDGSLRKKIQNDTSAYRLKKLEIRGFERLDSLYGWFLQGLFVYVIDGLTSRKRQRGMHFFEGGMQNFKGYAQ